jgi:hypothetical protein
VQARQRYKNSLMDDFASSVIDGSIIESFKRSSDIPSIDNFDVCNFLRFSTQAQTVKFFTLLCVKTPSVVT